MFKFFLGQKVFVVKNKIERDYNKKVKCHHCFGCGEGSEYDADSNLYQTICDYCDGTGEVYADRMVYWPGETIVTAIHLSGTRELPKVEYYFKKYKHPSIEENIFSTEAEAIKKCEELNNQ
jgi:hypothetical protein